MARRAAVDAEAAYAALAERLHPPRGPLDIVVADNVDYSNGFTTTFPTNRIVVDTHPPLDSPSLEVAVWGLAEDGLERPDQVERRDVGDGGHRYYAMPVWPWLADALGLPPEWGSPPGVKISPSAAIRPIAAAPRNAPRQP